MKKTTILLILFWSFIISASGQSGKVFDQLNMRSEILNMERNFAIYLPPDYETSQRDYPVLYLLHGGGDDQTGWIQFGEVLRITDKAIKDGIATPMVIVMPDANTGKRGYFNRPGGEWQYEDFFFKELMPYVEKKYRIKGEKKYRAIAGLSMGGGGSTIYALHHPELFSSACPLSASINNTSIEELIKRYNSDNLKLSENQIKSFYENYNAHVLVNKMDVEILKSVRWYFDCGDDDFLYEGNSLMHIAFRKKEIPHEYRVRQGGHNWTYWRESLPNVLEFVTQTFHQY